MKIFLIILGAFLTLLGVGCTVGGIGTLVVVGNDGWIQSGTDQVDVQGAALVTGTEEIEGESPGDDIPGEVRIRIRAQMPDDSPVFIGVARASDATAYLQGVPVDVVDDVEIDPTELETEFVPGTEELEPPEEQDFWIQSVSGSGRQELDWEVESGQFRFVVTPVEPQEGFAVNVSAGVKLPFLRWVAIGLIIAGVILLAAGVLLIVLGVRRKDHAPEITGPPPPPPADAGTAQASTADQPTTPPPPPPPTDGVPADRDDEAPSSGPPPPPTP
jgi:hypothetical protein